MSAHTTVSRSPNHDRQSSVPTEGWRDVSDSPEPEEILSLLDDQYAAAILRQTRDTAMSATELSEACEISVSTVYRRVDRLVDCELLAERQVVQADGNHYSVYEARVDELSVSLTDDGFEITVSEKPPDDLADRFTDIWEGL